MHVIDNRAYELGYDIVLEEDKVSYFAGDEGLYLELDIENTKKGANKMKEEKYTMKEKAVRYYNEHRGLYLGVGIGVAVGASLVLLKYAEVRVNKEALRSVKKVVTIAPKRQ